MSVTASLATRLSDSVDANALAELAGKALEEGEEERALPLVERGAVQSRSALLWQWKALLERSLDEHERALGSFEEAARGVDTSVQIPRQETCDTCQGSGAAAGSSPHP